MSADPNQIRSIIQNTRDALRRGDLDRGASLGRTSRPLRPLNLEDSWLLMAAVSSPRASLAYAQRALAINPQSQRAHKAVDWARSRPGAEIPVDGRASPKRSPGRSVEGTQTGSAENAEAAQSGCFPIRC